jgi:hypothetical protein
MCRILYSGSKNGIVGAIICFKIKNPPHCNRKRRQLLFLLCLQVSEKSGVMKENC